MVTGFICTTEIIARTAGASAVVTNELKAQSRYFDDVKVVDANLIGCPAYNVPSNPFFIDYIASQIVRERGNKFDLAHFNGDPFGRTIEEIHKINPECKIVVDCPAHNRKESIQEWNAVYGMYPFNHMVNPFLYKLYTKHIREADIVLSASRMSKKHILNDIGAKNVKVIRHGTYIPEYVEPPDDFKVGYMGAIGPDKGLKYLMMAWGAFVHDDGELHFAGKHSNSLSKWKSAVENANPHADIHLRGFIDNKWNFYNDMSVYVQPCYSEDSNLLTATGIKSIWDVEIGDLVWTLNNNKLELNPIEKIYINPYVGQMINFTSNQFNLSVTPNHRMYYYTPKQRDILRTREAIWFLNKTTRYYIPTTGLWDGTDCNYINTSDLCNQEYPSQYRVKDLPDKLYLPSLLRLIGWYIAKGYIQDIKGNRFVHFANQDEVNLGEISDLVKDIGLHPTRDNGCIKVYSVRLTEILEKCGSDSHNKKIPDWCLQYSTRLLKELYDGIMKGGGSVSGNHVLYYTVSDQLRDDLIQLCLKMGYSPRFWRRFNNGHIINKTGQCIGPSQYWMISIRQLYNKGSLKCDKHISTSGYNGIVWCVQTQNHNLFVERNGIIALSGNSVTEGFGIPLLEAMAAGRPVIASKGVGASELIKDGKSGLLFEPRDAETLLTHINYFYDNPNEVKKMGLEARKVAKRYTWDKIQKKYINVYRRLLE